MDWTALAKELVTLLVVIDPVGTIPVFLFAVQGVPRRLHRRFALHAVAIAALVLLAFLVGGQFLLETLGLRLGSFQIAGGVILFLFAMTMIFGDSKPAREIEEAGRDHLAGAVFPLAMPSIAEQAITAGLLMVVLALTLVLLLAASFIHRVIGNTGASVISRVMGIILATIAVDSVIGGFDALGILDVTQGTVQSPLVPGASN